MHQRGGRLVGVVALVAELVRQSRPCWSQPRCRICTTRTPRSTSRRASKALWANEPGLVTSGPYRSSVAFGSLLRSVSSGTLDCMRNAISYCAMRVCVSGSPSFSKLALVESLQRVEHRAAVRAADAVRVLQVEHRVAGAAQGHAVVAASAGTRCAHMRVNSAWPLLPSGKRGVKTTNAGRSLFSLPRP